MGAPEDGIERAHNPFYPAHTPMAQKYHLMIYPTRSRRRVRLGSLERKRQGFRPRKG
jgi:hypothetical protein